MLGITPDTDIEEVLNIDRGLPAYAQRSYRAYARSKDAPAKAVSLLEGMLLAPQMAEKWDQGRTPQIHDVASDVAETAALGKLKIAAAPVKTIAARAGSVSALDAIHDAVDDAVNEKTYSGGEYPDSGKDYSDIADPSRLGGLVGGLAAGLGVRSLATSGGPLRGIGNTVKRYVQKSEDKVEKLQKGADKVRKETAEGVAEIDHRKQDIVGKMENPKSALKALNASRKSAKKEKLSMDEFMDGLRADLSEANMDQTALERTAAKSLAETQKKIRNERQKAAIVQLFGSIPMDRMMYNNYSRNRALDAIDEIRGATRPR